MMERGLLVFCLLVLFTCLGCAQENKSDASAGYTEMISSAYRVDDRKEILEIIEDIKEKYGHDVSSIQSYYINLAQLYYRAGETELAIEALESEPTVLKFFYLGTLKKKIGRNEQGGMDLEKFYLELTGNDKEVDQTVVLITMKLLGYSESNLEGLDAQMEFISTMSQEELLRSIWP